MFKRIIDVQVFKWTDNELTRAENESCVETNERRREETINHISIEPMMDDGLSIRTPMSVVSLNYFYLINSFQFLSCFKH